MLNGYKIDVDMAINDGRYESYKAIPFCRLQKFLITLIREIREIKDISNLETFQLFIDGCYHGTICVGKISLDPLIYEFY